MLARIMEKPSAKNWLGELITVILLLKHLKRDRNKNITNPDKPEKKAIFYHEITKGRNHEKDHESFRVFQFSCFRD